MAKSNVLDYLYTKKSSPLEFNFDMLTAPPLLSLVTPQDIFELNRIARSVKLSGKIEEKYKLIDNIMTNRGFIKLHAGTNRVVYRFIEDQRFVVKVAVDRVGLGDNPAEFKNQFLLKPFVTKVFEVSPCGTVGLFERVDAIMSREEFASVADDIFNLITKIFVGKYVLEDFGTQYFMNWGIRKNGMGLVLLDFPYVYELDGNKLYCNAHPPGRKDIFCGGELDYDNGFNNLICTKCGRHYHARDLKKAEKEELIIVGGKKTMKVKVMVGNEVILDSSKRKVAKVIEQPEEVKSTMKVHVDKPREAIFNKEEEKPVVEERLDDAMSYEDKVRLYASEHIVTAPAVIVADDSVNKNDRSYDYESIDNVPEDEEPEEENVEIDDYEEPEDVEETGDYEDEEEDAEDYDQYLNNRQRSQIRKASRANKANSDFSGF